MSSLPLRPDYDAVPAGFQNVVCGCGSRDSFDSPINWPEGEYWDGLRAKYKLPFPWWVCSNCLKPAPMNALNARLIRECEMCESPYLISTYPDRMDLCASCL